ncbi:membrane protein [Paractinoplanes rishiriensis]|uniref:Membrane protein n=1 Tax=Paractinoplanes rishiriensis TaxID=1050105 RepID=A0A919K0X5_9ACTN|nr:membrane protein [Actinoplanes rishiriensis]
MTVLLVAAAVVLALPVGWPGGVRRRLDLALATKADVPSRPAKPPADEGRRSRLLLAAVAGLAMAGLVGGWFGVPLGVGAAVGAERLLRRREPPGVRKERLAASADLPLGADLLAAALRAGAPLDRAAAAVAEALGGQLGERLQRTARSLRLGAEPAEAWAHLAGVTGADRLAAAAVRSSASGGALAGALVRLADDLRADRAIAVERAGQRAGVLVVLPLGLCFLPAFLLAGLVPVLIAVLGDVL